MCSERVYGNFCGQKTASSWPVSCGNVRSTPPLFTLRIIPRVDGGIFKVCGIHPDKGMNWKQYALALLLTNAVMVFVGYLVLRIQFLPIFNPNGIGAMEETLSFNTIISFMTNTNLQHYSGTLWAGSTASPPTSSRPSPS